MGFYRSLTGLLWLEVTGADVYGTLQRLFDQNITVLELKTVSELTLQFAISRQDLKKTEEICHKYGDSLRIVKKRGLHWAIQSLCKRPVLVLGILLIIALVIYLPSRIWIVQVQGNVQTPQRLILESAAECGIRFGASRRMVRSEQMKNSLLGAMPELQWAGINTYGCRAVITVRERQLEHVASETPGVSSIVASMDGVVTECTVTGGNGMCSPGQAVTRGQVLISGYTDCGITIKATRAEGEITALTRRELTVVTPSESWIRRMQEQPKSYYSLILGKKRINFYKGSGISCGSCVKMYSKYVLMLPGGFKLPLSIVRETIIPVRSEPEQIPNPEEMLSAYAESYLSGQMIAGRILQKDEQIQETGGSFCLIGTYACLESIGTRQEEKIGE